MRIPKNRHPSHPGEIIKKFILDEFKISQTMLSERLNVSRRTINQLVNKQRPLSTIMALRLSKLTNTSPEYWINFQTAYDLFLIQNDKSLHLEKISAIA